MLSVVVFSQKVFKLRLLDSFRSTILIMVNPLLFIPFPLNAIIFDLFSSPFRYLNILFSGMRKKFHNYCHHQHLFLLSVVNFFSFYKRQFWDFYFFIQYTEEDGTGSFSTNYTHHEPIDSDDGDQDKFLLSPTSGADIAFIKEASK